MTGGCCPIHPLQGVPCIMCEHTYDEGTPKRLAHDVFVREQVISGLEDKLAALLRSLRALQQHSTREIVADSVSVPIAARQGPRNFGHNPSWIKASELADLLAPFGEP